MPNVDFPLPSNLPRTLIDLIQNAPLPGLDSGPKCKATSNRIDEVLSAHPKLRGSLTEAAIWLLAGDLERSHEVSQSLETAEGSFWHGVMHRREGDFWNAKYWFRKVGKHPVLEQLASHVNANSKALKIGPPLLIQDLSSPTKLAAALVDSCERALSSQPEEVNVLRQICWLEWQFLFLYGWE